MNILTPRRALFPKIVNFIGSQSGRRWLCSTGASLLFFSVITITVFLPDAVDQNSSLAQQLRDLERNLQEVGQSDQPSQFGDVRSRLATFSRLSAVANDLDTYASENGLQIIDVAHKPVAGAINKTVFRFQIIAHLKGSYPSVKKTISALLATHDGLTLESIAMDRTTTTDSISNVELIFVFYYR